MTTIFIKDDLRASVEAASGGRQTVLYTAQGQPSYMNIIPRFNVQDIDGGLGAGTHPAFIVGGVERSEIFVGTYPGIVVNNELLSLPGVAPSVLQNHDQFVASARACGPGWHVLSSAEWAALALWCWRNGFMPRGNTGWGQSTDAAWETARRVDGGRPGHASGSGVTLTGSGPASWRHDNSSAGIADLCGNVWEWAPGMRVVAGELQVIPDNNTALNGTDLSATSAAWRAIDGNTGALLPPTFTGTLAGGNYLPTTAASVRYATSGTANHTLVRTSGASFEGMTNPGATPVAAAALQVLRRYGLFPVAATGLGADVFWLEPTGERLLMIGGSFHNGSNAGVFARYFGVLRTGVFDSVGARPAYVS